MDRLCEGSRVGSAIWDVIVCVWTEMKESIVIGAPNSFTCGNDGDFLQSPSHSPSNYGMTGFMIGGFSRLRLLVLVILLPIATSQLSA